MIKTYTLSVLRFLGALAGTLTRDVRGAGASVLGFVETWLLDAKHAQYGLAVTRILLGVTGVGLLLTNFSTRLYVFGSGSAWNGEAAEPTSDFPKIWLFSLFHRIAQNDTLFTLAYLVLLVLAVLVVLGWRMKLVLPVYFIGWVSFIEVNDMVGDQGDNMYRITLMTLLFADTARRWSLDSRRRAKADLPRTAPRSLPDRLRWVWAGERYAPEWLTNVLHNLALVVITCHVCFVYASGALYKASGEPWQQGYAIYNPLHVDRFSPWPGLADVLTAWAPAVALISWASIIIQMGFPMMLANRITRIIALFGILAFHVGIAVLMGLPWFSLAMIAIDAIFIRDVTWQQVSQRVGDAWARARPPQQRPRPAKAAEKELVR